jgi:AraC-like DNA-binding protein
MISGHYFKRIRRHCPLAGAYAKPSTESLLAILSRSVIERFSRICDLKALVIPLDRSRSQDSEDPPPTPCHPACTDQANSDYCRESWQLHMAELSHRPETHWHTCDRGRLCAYVPVVYRGQCLAAVKLACLASTPEEEFERHVRLLDTLVEDFVAAEAEFLGRLAHAAQPEAESLANPSQDVETPVQRRSSHPQVLRALQYIEEHLSDPKLSVAGIARELDINPYYLSHLFADQVGQRMSRVIAATRVERAKGLLATTHWQIKRIARETGHANPNWFSHVFSIHTGVTPNAYRKRAHIRPREV